MPKLRLMIVSRISFQSLAPMVELMLLAVTAIKLPH